MLGYSNGREWIILTFNKSKCEGQLIWEVFWDWKQHLSSLKSIVSPSVEVAQPSPVLLPPVSSLELWHHQTSQTHTWKLNQNISGRRRELKQNRGRLLCWVLPQIRADYHHGSSGFRHSPEQRNPLISQSQRESYCVTAEQIICK